MPGYSVAAVALAALISGSRAYHICGNYCGERECDPAEELRDRLTHRMDGGSQEQHSGVVGAIDVRSVMAKRVRMRLPGR